MRSKLKIIIPVVVLVFAVAAYKLVLAKPAPAAKMKVEGPVYVLPREFLVNLADGRYAKVNVALVLDTHAEIAAAKTAATPPEGFGTLPQEAIVRDIIANTLTGQPSQRLRKRSGRAQLKKVIKARVLARTDVKVDRVLITDAVVQ